MFLIGGKLPVSFSIFSVLLACCFWTQTVHAQQDKIWRPVTPVELAMKTPQVEPDADAEAIFWEVRVDDKKIGKLSYNHYVRVKIFTERGREKFSKFDIPFYKGKKVEDVAARVIKPDGSIVTLQPSDIFEREIVKANKIKVKAKSFAVPGIEPGVIVEYQYSETFKNDSAAGERLLFQRDIPMQQVTYYVRPYKGMRLNFVPFNMSDVRFVEGDDRFYVGKRTNVPALKEEPYMPPEDQVRSWTYLSYAPLNIGNEAIGSVIGWSLFANRYAGLQALMTKSNKNVKKQAEQIVAGATTDEEKLRKIYTYVQTQIKNISYDTTLTDEQREKVDIDRVEDIIKERAGTSFHVNLLMGALASAAGLDTRLFFSSNRSEMFFDPNKVSNGGFLHNAGIAVKTGETWMYLDPGTPYLGFGDMFWHDEDTVGMLIDQSRHYWVKTPLVSHTKSHARRMGKFKLLEDGTLEGEARIAFSGNQAVDRREGGFRDSPAKREEDFKAEIKARVSTAEISALTVENFDDNTKPLVYNYKIRIPNYAQKTGKRLFLQPGFFEYGSSAVFSSATRKNEIFFPYPWSESDSIKIEVPKNLALDNADAPQAIEDPKSIGSLRIKIFFDKATGTMSYERNFHFGNGAILFPVEAYQPLKNMFDGFYKADTHAITLKQQ